MNASRKKLPIGLGFAAAALLAAVAVFVPLTSAGHSRPNAAAPETRRPDIRPAIPAAEENRATAPDSTKQTGTPAAECGRDTCDVQLD